MAANSVEGPDGGAVPRRGVRGRTGQVRQRGVGVPLPRGLDPDAEQGQREEGEEIQRATVCSSGT